MSSLLCKSDQATESIASPTGLPKVEFTLLVKAAVVQSDSIKLPCSTIHNEQ
jgi:hypothetical protein